MNIRTMTSMFASRRFILAYLLILLATACSKQDSGLDADHGPIPCIYADSRCRARLEIGGGLMLPYYRSFPLDARNPSITAALIIVHGSNRDADRYFATGIFAATEAGRKTDTIIIAPNFQTIDDDPAPDEAYWTSGGWKKGHLSVADELRPQRVSSYAALDRIVETLGDRNLFPLLETVVIAGHSAGGQVTHRYAAGNRVEQGLNGIHIRYVVANPSTYLYLGLERAAAGTLHEFALPDYDACPTYNNWHYGLSNLNTYMSALSLEEIRNQLVSRDVVIYVGSADTGSSMLDVSCGAMLQGLHRYYRGLTLINYMNTFYPGNNHTLEVLPGVGHSSRTMFTSHLGLTILFEP